MSTFTCLRCGNCCTHLNKDYSEKRYIPIFYDEIRDLENLANQLNVNLKIIPDLMYPDKLNKVYIITSYVLTFPDTCCFYNNNECLIHENRPLTCQSFPVSVWREDGHRKMLKVETSCKYVKSNMDSTLNKDFEELKLFFPDEYKAAEKSLVKGKEILFKIVRLEKEKKIDLGYLDGSINMFYDFNLASQEHPDWKLIDINLIEMDEED
ncbi:MAG: YkgJ family cysteine cluster protein [Candidatus Helarchaeota archaeon]